MKASILSLLTVAVAASATKVISTKYATEIYTITSCAPTVTDCPVGHETSTIHTYTTECDEEPYPTAAPEYSTAYETDVETITSCPPEVTDCPASHKPTSTKEYEASYTTSTVYETKEYTITSCAPTVTNCPVGQVTTTIIASTTVCPVTEKPTGPTETHPYPPPAEETSKPYTPPTEETSAPYSPPAEVTTKGPETTLPYSPPAETSAPAPILSTQTISTCVPTVIYSVVTVTGASTPTAPAVESPTSAPVCPGGPYCPSVTTVKGPYGTAAPSGYPIPPQNGTVPFTGGANTQRVGGLLLAVCLAAALL